MSVDGEIWVICETRDGEILECCFELLGKAASLAARNGSNVCAVFFGEVPKAAALFASGAAKIYLSDGFERADDGLLAEAIAALARRHKPETLLMAATVRGRSIAPQAAALLNTGLTADCTDLHLEDGLLIQTRPALGGNLMAQIVCAAARPQMATVRPRVFPMPSLASGREGEIVRVPLKELLAEKTPAKAPERVGTEKISGNRRALNDADIILAGGMGLGGKAGFIRLEALADAVGASLAASRAAVHAGFAPYASQVGQTGVVVRPRLYVAFGISGAVQHLAGMSVSEYIVAVNTDGKAPIFRHAHFGLVADAMETLELLLSEFA
ncbi:MAG: electron transfer flavoprotein subunit alpha/FixB family protein [Candidatus Accumulibacter sp.]|jgi:electron transfer flavoprotein alpha subunit|nr:electron transfer flavoprotein subunit alpha/FixB family protein [Accumulibacter sp.]